MLWDVALKTLWRNKLRTLLTIIGVAVAVQLYLVFNGVLVTYRDETGRQLRAFAGKIIVEQPVESNRGNTDLTASGSSLPMTMVGELLAVNGIDRAASSAMVFIPIVPSSMPYMPPDVLAVGVQPGHETAFLGSYAAASGVTAFTGLEEVILGQSAARFYQPKGRSTALAIGEMIGIQGHSLKVVGILKGESKLFDNAAIMPLQTAQTIFDRPDFVSSVILTAAHVEAVSDLKTRITTSFTGLQVSTQEDLARGANGILNTMDKFFSVIMNSFIVVAIIVITIVVVVAVLEQRQEIGVLRAVGAARWRIFLMIACESLGLSLLGAMLALPVAYFLERFGMSKFSNPPSLLVVWWGQTMLVACVVGVLAALLPSWQALRVNPLEALQYE